MIVRIFNGLGNQLFQYAAARAMAIKHESEIMLDTSVYHINRNRRFALDRFNIVGKIASEGDIQRHFGRHSGALYQSALFRIEEKIRPAAHRRLYVEQGFQYNEAVESLAPPVYLNGCWQSERYFSNCEDVIRREFTLKDGPGARNSEWLKRISRSNAVCVHVRRGDYVTDRRISAIHGTCDQKYYHEAEDIIVTAVKDPVFFVFSDEPNWARSNVRFLGETYWVSGSVPERDYEEFELMCACRHFIIANSSFSWWAAWLGECREKTVVAPKNWFRTRHRDTADLYPADWTVI